MSVDINTLTRPQNISDRVWQDFVEVYGKGRRPTDVAQETDRKPSSISANVKRVRLTLGLTEDDAAPRQGGNGGSTPSTPQPIGLTDEEKYKIADDMLPPFGRMFVHERERMAQATPKDDDVRKAEDALTRAQDALAEAQARYEARVAQYNAEVSAFTEAAAAAGFDYAAFDEAVALATAEMDAAVEQGEAQPRAAVDETAPVPAPVETTNEA